VKLNSITLVVIPHKEERSVWEKSFSPASLFLLLTFLLLFLGGWIFLAQSYLSHTYQDIRLRKLAEENELLKNRLSQFQGQVQELDLQMALLTQREKSLRVVADLPDISSQVREVGVGGEGGGPPDPLFFYDEQTAQQTENINLSLERLLRQTKLEKKSLAEIWKSLENKRYLLSHTPSIKPAVGYISRGFGMQIDPFTGQLRPHYGIDFAARVGTPVWATADGRVANIGWDKNGFGTFIEVDHRQGYQTYYAHLSKVEVGLGKEVKRGQLIGRVGNTGRSTGPHLHYEVRVNGSPVNPRNYFSPENIPD
jgi:murein DD-endopeptidase MepM/ murein hydrolase activator NlpD